MLSSSQLLLLAVSTFPVVDSFLAHRHTSHVLGVQISPTSISVLGVNSVGEEADDYSAVGSDSGLGDLAGGMETTMDYLPNFTPLERIAITATGNLQRIISSYYNSPVTVKCVHNEELGPGVFDREVDLLVRLGDQPGDAVRFCTARSTVVVRSPEVAKAVKDGVVGVGQLFRHYNVLPKFRLIDAGRSPGGFWRFYELNSEVVRCSIREEFRADTFELHKQPFMRTAGKSYLQSRRSSDDGEFSIGALKDKANSSRVI